MNGRGRWAYTPTAYWTLDAAELRVPTRHAGTQHLGAPLRSAGATVREGGGGGISGGDHAADTGPQAAAAGALRDARTSCLRARNGHTRRVMAIEGG